MGRGRGESRGRSFSSGGSRTFSSHHSGSSVVNRGGSDDALAKLKEELGM